MSCGYDLHGLPQDGVCPECAIEIQSSIHAALEREHAAGMRLPSWLRVVRTAYFTAWCGCVVSPFTLIPLGQQIGYTNLGAFFNALSVCGLATFAFGILLSSWLLSIQKHSAAVVLSSAITMLILLAMQPAISN